MKEQLKVYDSIFENLNISVGDILLIATDLKKVIRSLVKKRLKFDADVFINYFKNRVGNDGAVLFPTYNFDFCEGVNFDYYKTESKMGFITNIALGRNDFIRTQHPIYSFAVSGKYCNDFFNLNNKQAFGLDSPFALLHRLNAKMLLIDVDYQNSFTFVHYVEQQEKVNYRFHKEFNALYTDNNGKVENKVYSMFVRKNNIQTNVNPIGKTLEEQGASEKFEIDKHVIRLIDLKKSFDVIKNNIQTEDACDLYLKLKEDINASN